MSVTAAMLGVLGTVAVVAAVLVLRADLGHNGPGHDERKVRRRLEALVPLVGLIVLVIAVWAGR